jgi:uncharacterized OB-fold protein
MVVRTPPRLGPINRFYWESGRDGVLRLMRCQDCGTWLHPAKPLCSSCLSENVAPQATSGTGTVYSITINHQAWQPGLEVPYAIARVALDGVDGVLLTTNIVGPGALDTQIGDTVRVTFEEQNGIWYPLFERA